MPESAGAPRRGDSEESLCQPAAPWRCVSARSIPSTAGSGCTSPSARPGARGYLETTFDSWFFLGKLGGFSAENLQAHEADGADLGWLAYDAEAAAGSLPALMHNMGPIEYQGLGRCWWTWAPDAFGLGRADQRPAPAGQRPAEIEELCIGGINDDWPVEEQGEALSP